MALQMQKVKISDEESVALFKWTRPEDQKGCPDQEAMAPFQTAYVAQVDESVRDADGFCRCTTIEFDGSIVEHRFYPTDGDPLCVGDTVCIDRAGHIVRARSMDGTPRNGTVCSGWGNNPGFVR